MDTFCPPGWRRPKPVRPAPAGGSLRPSGCSWHEEKSKITDVKATGLFVLIMILCGACNTVQPTQIRNKPVISFNPKPFSSPVNVTPVTTPGHLISPTKTHQTPHRHQQSSYIISNSETMKLCTVNVKSILEVL
jgi:hypothetical protein